MSKGKIEISVFLCFLMMMFLVVTGCGGGGGGAAAASGGGGGGGSVVTDAIIADHTKARLSVLDSISDSALADAKSKLVIAYGHTSHGSQIVDGINGLDAFMTLRGHASGDYSGLNLRDTPFSGADDLGAPNLTAWEAATRTYLNAHTEVNVVVWSWCGQVSSASAGDITNYLSLMNGLESSYPTVKFVYMTGHLDGGGLTGNLHLRNEQIRAYCLANNKILFDFADIETYNPDDVYFGDKHPNDACDYDGGNNWATAWRALHTENVDWYDCSSAHSDALNANMKAYAFWWLMAQIAQ